MSIWTSRALWPLLAGLFLAGCETAGGLAFQAGPGNGSRALSRAELAGGDIVLSPPQGYCIDRRSLRRGADAGFAVIARCDTLGARGFFGAFELALIAVTSAPHPADHAGPTLAELSRSAASGDVLEQSQSDGLALIRLRDSSHETVAFNPEHWRGAFALNGQLIGLSLYTPRNGPALRRDGALLLRELTRRTRAASARPAAAQTAALQISRSQTE